MNDSKQTIVFGEVLFDCFPGGERVLGGAPFNVAWHLHALGEQPRFISGIGDDEQGRTVMRAIEDWGMDTAGIQLDTEHPTGRVEIEVIDNEPHYDITPDCAYDFIDAEALPEISGNGLLYHGTLGVRNAVSRAALARLAQQPGMSIFLDVNLRSPWWQQDDVFTWLEQARWVKLNHDEIRLLGFAARDIESAMAELQSRFQLEQVILTRAEQGAVVRNQHGEISRVVPDKIRNFVDTVGAGDAFTSIYIHGLMSGWPITDTLHIAQQFAARVIGLRGATSKDPDFYRDFIDRI